MHGTNSTSGRPQSRSLPLSRRSLLAGLAALAIWPATALAIPADMRLRAITIDTAPMAAKGVRPLVELMRRSTMAALQKAFADRLVPGDRGAATLRVVLDSASIASDAYSSDHFDTPADFLEGKGVLIGPRGEILGEYPLLAQYPVPVMDRSVAINGYDLRGQLLAESFAYWLRRQMGI